MIAVRQLWRPRRQIGNVFEDAWDFAEDAVEWVGQAAEDIGGTISDAADEIGAVLKFIAPALAFIPGVGTALSVAITAAATVATGDPLDEAVISIASAAMPGPIARAAFDSGADVTVTWLKGGDVVAAALRAGRQAATMAGGARAAEAFDVGVAVAKGAPLGAAPWQLARAQIAPQGPTALAAFDAAVSIKNGGNVGDAALAAARVYVVNSGGPLAAVAFDTGVALGEGKSLQDAGFAGLKAFVAGNDAAERALGFVETMIETGGDSRKMAIALSDALSSEVGRYGTAQAAAWLGPVLEQWVPEFDDMGSFALAAELGLPEEIARAAQAVMRDGEIDVPLLDRLTKGGVQTAIDKYGARVVASRGLFVNHTEQTALNREALLMDLARLDPSSLSFRRAREEAGAPLPVPPALETSAPSSARHSVASDLALGGVVAAAGVALVLWARS